MAGKNYVVEISSDQKKLICRYSDGKVKWSKAPPSIIEWERLALRKIDGDITAGRFQYVGNEFPDIIIVVFTPSRGLDFNLAYSADNGGLLRIDEAR